MDTKTQYYLDTSACRYFGHYLVEYSKLLPFFVSSLTLIEIISPLKESPDELERIRSLVRIITECASIDWRFPEELIAGSFENVSFEEKRVSSLRNVVESIKRGDSYPSVLASASPYDLDFFSSYDQYLSHILQTDKHEQTVALMKEAHNRQKENTGFFSEEETNLPYIDMIQLFNTKYFELNFSLTKQVIAGMVLQLLGREENEQNVENMYNEYNRNANAFIMAFSIYGIDRLSKHEQSARNDFIDLLHFLYVKPNDRIISADNLILNLANRIQIGLGGDATKVPKH